jgi:hypothetical protein
VKKQVPSGNTVELNRERAKLLDNDNLLNLMGRKGANSFDMYYLITSLPDIVKKKLAHDFCKKCKRYGLSAIKQLIIYIKYERKFKTNPVKNTTLRFK